MQGVVGVMIHVEMGSTSLLGDEVRDGPRLGGFHLHRLDLRLGELGQEPLSLHPTGMDEDEAQVVRGL